MTFTTANKAIMIDSQAEFHNETKAKDLLSTSTNDRKMEHKGKEKTKICASI